MWAFRPLRTRAAAIPRRFFSIVSMSTIWRLRINNASSSRLCSSFSGRTSGRMVLAYSASTRASMRSVLASFPQALAKSRTWRGFMTTTGNPAAASCAAITASYPPVASSTINVGAISRRRATTSARPASSFALLQNVSWGNTPTSNVALDTSIPTNCSFRFMLISLTPNLVKYGLHRPANCSGSFENDVTIQASPRALHSQRHNDLSRRKTFKLLTHHYYNNDGSNIQGEDGGDRKLQCACPPSRQLLLHAFCALCSPELLFIPRLFIVELPIGDDNSAT